jgi:hypothetical protein
MPVLDAVGLDRRPVGRRSRHPPSAAWRARRRDHRHRPGRHAGRRRGRHAAARDRRARGYPVRMVPLLRMIGMTPAAAVARAWRCARSTDALRLGRIKIVADGSIQGFSARLRWPGYFNGAPNGLWYTAPEAMRDASTLALRAGRAGAHPHQRRRGHRAGAGLLRAGAGRRAARRPPLHAAARQLADRAQFRRMKALGLCVNLFANHLSTGATSTTP